MTVPLFTPQRTVLLVGDEALYVYAVSADAVRFVDSVPWQTEDFEEFVAGLIRKECRRRPVLILNDMTDQHFKGGQRLPNVGLMDRGNILKRRLHVAFPNYPIRGALPVQGEKGKGKGKGKSASGDLYLFAAVPVLEPITKTLEAVRLSMVSVAGFVLLPIESSDLAEALSIKLAGKGRKHSRWAVLLGQHQSGALRQVITRNGKLAMTRMTPVSDPDSSAQAWAQDVAQEFKATIGYLSRFGYSPEDGTDVIAVCGKEAGGFLEKLVDVPCHYSTFTAPEAARLLGIKLGVQEDVRFSDALHVGWAGRKAKFVLPMEADEIRKIYRPRQLFGLAVLLVGLLIVGQGYYLFGLLQSLLAQKNDLFVQQGVLAQAESEHQNEIARMEALGFDVTLIQGTIHLYESLERERLKLLPVLKAVGASLGADLRLDALTLDRVPPEETQSPGALPNALPPPSQIELRLSLSFPPTIQLEFGIREINMLRKRLTDALPDYKVEITRQIARPEYTQNIKGVAGRTAEEIAVDEDYVAELLIRGPER